MLYCNVCTYDLIGLAIHPERFNDCHVRPDKGIITTQRDKKMRLIEYTVLQGFLQPFSTYRTCGTHKNISLKLMLKVTFQCLVGYTHLQVQGHYSVPTVLHFHLRYT